MKAILSQTQRTDAVDVGVTAEVVTADSYRRMRAHAYTLEAELSRYKRLEALLRDRSDVEDVPDCGDEQRVRPNQAMSILGEWEGK